MQRAINWEPMETGGVRGKCGQLQVAAIVSSPVRLGKQLAGNYDRELDNFLLVMPEFFQPARTNHSSVMAAQAAAEEAVATTRELVGW